MNCKPGDLAIRIRAPEDAHIPVGSIVHVIRFRGLAVICGKSSMRVVRDTWEVESKMGPAGIPDSELKPLRDPGDDAIDETLLRLPAPGQKETA